MKFTDTLKELEAKATDGPWGVGMRNGANANGIYSYTGADSHDDPNICSVYGIHMHRDRDEVKGCDGYPNAELIAYLRSHAKEIINLVEAAENLLGATTYDGETDEIGRRVCCGELSYKPHEKHCSLNNALAALNKE